MYSEAEHVVNKIYNASNLNFKELNYAADIPY